MHNEDWPPLRLSLSRPSPYGLGRPAMGFRRQFAQQPVAGGLDDAAAMLGDLWVNNLGAERLEPGQSPFLVGFDQAPTARYIGGEDRREPTFDATWRERADAREDGGQAGRRISEPWISSGIERGT
jgi:hypothetical protein